MKRKTPDFGFETPTPSKKQNTLVECFERVKVWDVTDPRAIIINIKMAKWLVGGCHPINICEEPLFRDMISSLNKNYKVPSRDYITRRVIPSMNESINTRIMDILADAENISFSTDIWTSPHALDCFISLTGHILTKDFDAHCVILKAQHFDEKHIADQVSINLEKMLSEFKVEKGKVHYIVSDNASNKVKGVLDTDIAHLSCFLHTLNLIITNSIFVQDTNKKLIDKCKKLVSFYKKSPLAKAEFDNIHVDDEDDNNSNSSSRLRLPGHHL